ncbi:MAG TPA: DUF3455 domain-containing protein [Vicinamibacterales bacterium]
MMWRTTAFLLTLSVAVPGQAQERVRAPRVPDNLEVPAGHKAFLITHASGTQNYVCMPSGGGVTWAFHGPQATLFNEKDEQLLTHYLSPNPDQGGALQATWRHSRDTSTVWAVAIASYAEPDYVNPGAIPWLLLRVTGVEYGPAWGDKMARTTFIQRVNTDGGRAPASGCSTTADIGARAMVPYTTQYVFYR